MIERKIDRRILIIILSIFIGIICRFWSMSFGHNFDFESYCIVGDIAGHFKNVYANTTRYNYGPIFFCIQGVLWRLSKLISTDYILTFRVLIVSFLTFIDLCIALYIANRYSWKKAIVFFLNPVSIVISGYHNQFDNLAVLFALISIDYYNEDKTFNRNDYLFIIFMSLSLITKHILFLMPVFLLFREGLPLKKKLIYVAIPPFLFLLSFIPFALSSQEALQGIIQNVFLYRSFNNSPLLVMLYTRIGFPSNYRIIVFIGLMCAVGFLIRKKKYSFDYSMMIYLIAMVTFSSAIANQYLAIPMAALCILKTGLYKYFYMAATFVFLFLKDEGFGMLGWIQEKFPTFLGRVCSLYVKGGYIAVVWILFFTLLYLWHPINKSSNQN